MTSETLVIVDRALAASAFRTWANGSRAAFQHAAERKFAAVLKNKPGNVPMGPTNDLARNKLNEWTPVDIEARMLDLARTVHQRKGSVQEFYDQESFLRAYANATAEGFPLSEAIIHEIEEPFGKRMPEGYSRW